MFISDKIQSAKHFLWKLGDKLVSIVSYVTRFGHLSAVSSLKFQLEIISLHSPSFLCTLFEGEMLMLGN